MTVESPGLAGRIRAGDPEAQRLVVGAYLPQILRASRAAGFDGASADDACLEGVPTQQRMAFVLREVEGLVSEEICKILDVTRTNLGVLIFRARNRLRECLETRGMSR